MKRNNPAPVFPETNQVVLGKNHMMIIKLLLNHPEGLLQKNLVKTLHIDKTTISEAKDDLMRLGWITQIELQVTKEIRLIPKKIIQIKTYLGYWQGTGNCIYVRPHDIRMEGSLNNQPDLHSNILLSLTKKYRVVISKMKNNKQYIYKTEHGIIMLWERNKKVVFYIQDFILPVGRGEIEFFREHIEQEICRRLNLLIEIIQENTSRHMIIVHNLIVFRSLHLGILTARNTSKLIKINKMLKELGMYSDKSIPGCDELEAEGNPDKVFTKIEEAIKRIYQMKEEDKNERK